MADTLKQLTDNLTSQYYYNLWKALGSPDGFQLATGSEAVNTQDVMDSVCDGVPPLSLNNSFSGNPANTVSGNYRLIAVQLKPPTAVSTALTNAYASSWASYLSANADSVTYTPASAYLSSLQGLMMKWGAVDQIPQDIVTAGVNALAQDVTNPVSLGVNLLNQAGDGPYPWLPSAQDLVTDLANAQSISFSLGSLESGADLSDTWAEGAMDVFYDIFDFGGEGSYQDIAQSFMSQAFAMEVSMDIVAVTVVPAAAGQGLNVAGKDYPAWYDDALLAYAYKGQNNANVWGTASNWNNYFGPDGTLPRMVTKIFVAQNIQIKMSSSYAFSDSDYTHIQAAAAVGIFPFFGGEVSSSVTTQTSHQSDGTVTMTSSSPIGVPILIGVNVGEIPALMGS